MPVYPVVTTTTTDVWTPDGHGLVAFLVRDAALLNTTNAGYGTTPAAAAAVQRGWFKRTHSMLAPVILVRSTPAVFSPPALPARLPSGLRFPPTLPACFVAHTLALHLRFIIPYYG